MLTFLEVISNLCNGYLSSPSQARLELLAQSPLFYLVPKLSRQACSQPVVVCWLEPPFLLAQLVMLMIPTMFPQRNVIPLTYDVPSPDRSTMRGLVELA